MSSLGIYGSLTTSSASLSSAEDAPDEAAEALPALPPGLVMPTIVAGLGALDVDRIVRH